MAGWLDGTEFERVFSPCRLYFYDLYVPIMLYGYRLVPHTDRYFEFADCVL